MSLECVKSSKMSIILVLCTINFWFDFIHQTNAQSAGGFVIEKFYQCEDVPNQKINVSLVPKSFVPGAQVFDISLFIPIPLGNQLRYSNSVYLQLKLGDRSGWQHLFTAEDDFCRIVQTYIGEVAYEVETAMGIPRGICPIPKGHYHAVNYTMDFRRLKLQTFPFGKIRATSKFVEKSTKNVLCCCVAIISNNA